MNSQNILISLHPIYTDKILNGKKTIELRCRPIKLEKGSCIWLYSKLPRGNIEGYVLFDDIVKDTSDGIWSRFQKQCGISFEDFNDYFLNKENCYAIKLKKPKKLKRPISLDELQKKLPKFHPPQFFKKLSSDELRCFHSF